MSSTPAKLQVSPSKYLKELDTDGDGKLSAQEVLAGVYDRVATKHKARVFAAVAGATVQHIKPNEKETAQLEKVQGVTLDHETETAFSVRYQTWRRVNLSVAAFAVILRFGLTIFQVGEDAADKVRSAHPSYRDCKNSIITYVCDCPLIVAEDASQLDPLYASADGTSCLLPNADASRCQLVNADSAFEGCSNTCFDAGDGTCDDGGTGSAYDVCACGGDCADCGTRTEAQCAATGGGGGGEGTASPLEISFDNINRSVLPSGLTDAEMRLIRARGQCGSLYGVHATAAFPLLPDHIAASTVVFQYLGIFKIVVNLIAQAASIFYLWRAFWHWADYLRSRNYIRVAFGLAILPSCVLALTVPMRQGVNMNQLKRLVCRDVAQQLTDSNGVWVQGLDLPPQAEFCALPPETWARLVQDSIESSGLSANFNSSLGAISCGASTSRQEACRTQCAGCFADVTRTIDGVSVAGRNPCLDYLTFDRICRGRDEVFATTREQANAYSYGGSEFASGDPVALAASLSGGYSDPTSMCAQMSFQNCSVECDETFPIGGSFTGSQVWTPILECYSNSH